MYFYVQECLPIVDVYSFFNNRVSADSFMADNDKEKLNDVNLLP